jgi:predicted molibdopterin-dependent oxidoreductase YjgC
MTKKIQVVCPYCGGGCMLNLIVENGTILGAEPAQGKSYQPGFNDGSSQCRSGLYDLSMVDWRMQ